MAVCNSSGKILTLLLHASPSSPEYDYRREDRMDFESPVEWNMKYEWISLKLHSRLLGGGVFSCACGPYIVKGARIKIPCPPTSGLGGMKSGKALGAFRRGESGKYEYSPPPPPPPQVAWGDEAKYTHLVEEISGLHQLGSERVKVDVG